MQFSQAHVRVIRRCSTLRVCVSIVCRSRLNLLHVRTVIHTEVSSNWFPVIRRDCESDPDIRHQIAPVKHVGCFTLFYLCASACVWFLMCTINNIMIIYVYNFIWNYDTYQNYHLYACLLFLANPRGWGSHHSYWSVGDEKFLRRMLVIRHAIPISAHDIAHPRWERDPNVWYNAYEATVVCP